MEVENAGQRAKRERPKTDINKAALKEAWDDLKSRKRRDVTFLVPQPFKPLPHDKPYFSILDSAQFEPLDHDELGMMKGRPYHKFDFQDGFVVDDDQDDIAPDFWGSTEDPTGMTRGVPWPLVFSLLGDPQDPGTRLEKKIAMVKDKEAGGKKPFVEFYAYNLYTYGDARNESDLRYVFSGSGKTVKSSNLLSNTFIPFDILYTRLAGDVADRQKAYTRDWLSYCAYRYFLDRQRDRQSSRPKPDQHLLTWDGAHLQARDTAGNLGFKDKDGKFVPVGAKFLYHLLQPEDEKITFSQENLSRHIFKRWCLVAQIAASLDKEPFTVKARFYKIPKALNPNNYKATIDIIYDMLPGWWGSKSANDKILKHDNLHDNLRDVLKKMGFGFNVECQAVVHTLWESFMGPVFAEASASANSSPTANTTVTIIPRLRSLKKHQKGYQKEDLTQYLLLGSHPQGFYNTYILKSVVDALVKWKYTPGKRDFPRSRPVNEIVPPGLLGIRTDDNQNPVAETIISKPSIRIAGNWPRIRSQNAVMGGVSANEIAARIWDKDGLEPRCAEWLHRSAYSFGGGGKPDSAQVPENLVFGTFETNTEMIRYESYLKRLVNDAEEASFSVTLKTKPTTENSAVKGGRMIPWLVPSLKYEWSFNLNTAFNAKILRSENPAQMQIRKEVFFDLFSRKYPMLLEIEVDEAFDAALRHSISKELSAVVRLFLATQSECMTGPIRPHM